MTGSDTDRQERAERLLAAAVSEGRVELPTLTREELASLGALESGPWRDADELSSWSELGAEARKAVTVAAIRGLGARGLLDIDRPPAGTGDRVQLAAEPELGTVLVARAQPAFVVVGGEPESGRLGRVRLYGVVEEARGLRCVLTEVVEDNGLHRFALCSPARALSDLASWACAPPSRVDEEGRPHPMVRTLEVIRPSETGPVETRLLVLVGTEAVAVAEVHDDHAGEATIVTADHLRDRLRRLLPDGEAAPPAGAMGGRADSAAR